MFPELTNLTKLIDKHQLSVSYEGKEKDQLLEVDFRFNRSSLKLYIEDECGDFDLKNQGLCVYLVLKMLDDYKASQDFLEWTTCYYLNANDSLWLQYYRDLAGSLSKIESEIGAIDPFISGMDYELRAGAYNALVRLIE